MSLPELFTALFFFLYSVIFLWVGWQCFSQAKKSKAMRTSDRIGLNAPVTTSQKQFSVLIPFRNEARNLTDLFFSLNELNFPLPQFEVIFINDHSEDDGFKILEKLQHKARFSMRLIQLEHPLEFGKKQALSHGVEQAKYPWIATLDADCTVSKNWLDSLAQALNDPSIEFISGPVFLKHNKGLLYQMQAAEFMTLQALTQASFTVHPLLSNGANMVYSKNVFAAVSGFSGNLNISSGDDMFLMQKILRHKRGALAYNRDWTGAVYTHAADHWPSYAAQQIRWMSKTSALQDPLLTIIALIIFCTNSAIVIWFITCLTYAIAKNPMFGVTLKFTGLLLFLKFTLDHLTLWLSYGTLKEKKTWSVSKINWTAQIMAFLIYPFWTLGLTIISIFYRPYWKGRKIVNK
ncbi:MAG: glycosyltransferase [Bacteroidetes bacterium]|nr:glycosyltransferase [Bacteroidota bacterium]